jgi:heat-inducible transcriptional repressor
VEVLHAIVQSYIETGQPVASGAIARRRRDHLSSATIRNIMAELADHGYLDQPHTSAGRVPTAKAFRHYALSSGARSVSGAEIERLRAELAESRPEERPERASHALTELTRVVGIVASTPASAQTLDQVELLRLPDGRVLMVVVTSDGLVRNHVTQLAEPITQDDLASIRNYVNVNFSGWSLAAVRAELDRRLAEERATYDGLLRQLGMLRVRGLLDFGFPAQIFMEGASYLVGSDLHMTREKLGELFRALEEKRRLIELLDQFLDAPAGELHVQVGLEQAHPALGEFSLIGVHLQLPGGLDARMAVLGPLRMNYPRALSAVSQVGRILLSLPQ